MTNVSGYEFVNLATALPPNTNNKRSHQTDNNTYKNVLLSTLDSTK